MSHEATSKELKEILRSNCDLALRRAIINLLDAKQALNPHPHSKLHENLGIINRIIIEIEEFRTKLLKEGK